MSLRSKIVFSFGLVFLLAKSAADTDDGDASCAAKIDAPRVLRNGVLEPIDEALFQKKNEGDTASTAKVPGGEAVNLKYVRNFLSEDDIAKLIGFCDGRSGWTASPQNYGGDGSTVRASRTSNSCPIIWPLLYLPKMDTLIASGRLTPSLEEEIYFSWEIMQRIASFLNVDEGRIEPLQLIRYNPGEFYRQHHDHGSYYGVNTEQRPITFLLFLSSVPPEDGGGHTKFEKLDVAVLPRAGDGIIWSNTDEEGKVLMDAVHEAVPPKGDGIVVKHAMNVWIAKEPIMDNLDTASYRTS